jgi:hypothetical protein
VRDHWNRDCFPAPSLYILQIDETRIIAFDDDPNVDFLSSRSVGAVPRVLIAVAPPLLGDLLARQLDHEHLEVVNADDPIDTRDSPRHFDVVVTSGIPPPYVEAASVLQLPDRMDKGASGSLLTAHGVERVGMAELASVVQIVNELCGAPPSTDNR